MLKFTPRYVMFVGDIHGCIDHWKTLGEIAKDHDIDAVVQVGDFGYWEHQPEGYDYLDSLEHIMPCQLFFIDGNHDNHPLLWERYKYSQYGPFMSVRENVTYIRRGGVWAWNDVAFMAMGGGFSIDWEWRVNLRKTKGLEVWWATEEIAEHELAAALEAGAFMPPDIMITHDAPDGCPMDQLSSIKNLRADLEAHSGAHRAKIGHLVRQLAPKALVHGHYHKRLNYTLPYADTYCVSLGCEPQSLGGATVEDSYTVVDLEEVRQNMERMDEVIG